MAATAFHVLGNLVLAFVMFWTYISFAQYLIIYCANVPRETSWYLQRIHGSWQWFINLLAPRGVNRTGTITFTDTDTGSPQSAALVGFATP